MMNWKRWKAVLAVLVLMLSVHAVFGQAERPQTSSANGSGRSATRATDDKIRDACSAAADELAASQRLIALLETESKLLRERLDTERQRAAIYAELNDSRKAESDALRTALLAKNETLAAKDDVIATQQKLIETLKGKKRSFWSRLGDVAIGIAAGTILR